MKKVRIIILAINLLVLCYTSLFASNLNLQKAETYRGEDVTGWVMSRKYDGIRGYWDGEQLFTRKGHRIHVPDYFIKDFPPFALDGELFSEKGFEFTQSVVLDHIPGEGWHGISYNIFEVPDTIGDFLERLNIADEWFESNINDHVKIIKQIEIKDLSELDEFFDSIVSNKGEGVIVRDPKIPYRRTPHILKIKVFSDMEGTIISINKGKGKYINVMGSLTVQLKDRTIFKIGTGFSDKERANPPSIGSIITFKFYGFSKYGVPKFASYMRIRKD